MNDAFRFERRTATLSVVVSVALMAIKFVAYYLTGSSAIFSDALESIVNVMASALMLYSVVLAHAPADARHPYGHGKVEFLSAAFEGGMILLAALVIVARAVEQLFRGSQVHKIQTGIALTVGAMAVNGIVGMLLIRVGRRNGSIALEADGMHLLTDAVTTAAAIVALALVALTGRSAFDPIGALVIALYISIMAIGVLRRATAGLMDEQDVEDDRLIRSILDAHLADSGAGAPARAPVICSYHKLRHRHSGRYHWVDFHILVPAQWNVERGHEVASKLEYEIEQALGEGNATAHVEPCADEACSRCESERNLVQRT